MQALIDHPYFVGINVADISPVIDQYEDLLNGNGFQPQMIWTIEKEIWMKKQVRHFYDAQKFRNKDLRRLLRLVIAEICF